MTETVYPLLRDGGPLLAAFNGVQALLKEAFSDKQFKYHVVQPRMSAQRWADIARVAPAIGLSLASWNKTTVSGSAFYADLTVPVFLISSQSSPNDLLFGTKQCPGIAGMMAVAVFALDGRRIDGVGIISVKAASNLEAANWVSDRTAIATLQVVVKNVGFNADDIRAQLLDLEKSDGTWNFAPSVTQTDGANEA